MTYITNFVTREDIDSNLRDKLGNMLYSEISEEIYEKCLEEKVCKKIADKVWALMRNSASKFSKTDYYEDLDYSEDSEGNENMIWENRVYNSDLLYMTAIAHVLKLPTPRTAGDIEIFGM